MKETKSFDLKATIISKDQTHHLWDNKPLYPQRFNKVLKFHAPGLAPVIDDSGAFHITHTGEAFYTERYLHTFGYYENRAAVASTDGWFHLNEEGQAAYPARFGWCGNFQENACVVKDKENNYFHINLKGNPCYPERYRYVGDYREGTAVVCHKNGKHTHIDAEGNFIHAKWFQGLNVFHKSIACARDERGWFHINQKGEALYQARYHAIEPFYNNAAAVETHEGGLYTIDLSGNIITTVRSEIPHNFLQDLSTDLVGFWKTQTIAASVKLKILDYLPENIETISQKIKLSFSSCKRLLRGLQELGIVRQEKNQFVLTEKGKLLVPTANSAMASAALIWAEDHYQTWPQLTTSLQQTSILKNYFHALSSSPQILKHYHHALAAYAMHDYQNIIHEINWHKHQKIIDAGGGTGTLLHLILNNYPHLEGTLLERSEVIDLVTSEKRNSKIKYVGGDIFSTWPSQAKKSDAILLARVLHDWPDEEAIKILTAAKSSLASSGKIYIFEMVLPSNTAHGGLLDLNMLVMTGGKERTEAAWKKLAKHADLQVSLIHESSAIISLIVMEPLC